MIYFDYLGVFVASLSGALVATRKDMDAFGVLVLGVITGVGGGTLRDVLMDAPVFWVHNTLYFYDSLFAALLGLVFTRQAMEGKRAIAIIWFDAFAISFFAVSGSTKALGLGFDPIIAVVMGVFTASFGGVLRDVLANETPMLFRGEVYATPVIFGAIAVVVASSLGLAPVYTMTIGFFVSFIGRAMAIHFKWQYRVGPRA